jgi:tetratricopeptide (TPR) repeat protein
MKSLESLYQLFGVSSRCSDDELRRAYRKVLLKHHPDLNPSRREWATTKTQELTFAYAEIKRHRDTDLAAQDENDGEGVTIDVGGIKFTISFSFGQAIDLKDIARRKGDLRDKWNEFQKRPTDPIRALHLIHAAFRAGQQDSVSNLLFNPVLIDAAALLVSWYDHEDVSTTLISWAAILCQNHQEPIAVRILEDALSITESLPDVANELRRIHYAWAQYTDPTTGDKAIPEVRVEHLSRIIDLGFDYDYIHKLLAEAYHDLGKDEEARSHLTEAYRINPELTGAIRISQALGFRDKQKDSRRPKEPRKIYRFTRPEQVVLATQIESWADNGNCESILEYSNPLDYSPRILPKARETLCQIARSLGRFDNSTSRIALLVLFEFKHYWDVSDAALTSLAKIGDEATFHTLEHQKTRDYRDRAKLRLALSYLRARIDAQSLSEVGNLSPSQRFSRAEKEYAKKNYGQARAHLERLIATTTQSDPGYFQALLLLARSCAELGDTSEAVRLINPVYRRLPNELRFTIATDLTSWLWNELVFQDYAASRDNAYQLALDIHSELAMTANSPKEVLENLRTLTRWLEILGARDSVLWIRQLIRTEAPGTWYVDKDNRDAYFKDVELSTQMQAYLNAFNNQAKAQLTSKLKQVLKSAQTLGESDYLLDS